MIQLLIAMTPQGSGGGGGFTSTLIMFALIFVIFYFMILRPQQKRQKERQKLLESIKKGDKVVTASGIHGKIIAVEEKTVLVEIADNIKVKIERSAIGTVIKEASSE